MLAKASSARSAMRVFRRVAGAGGGAGSPALGSVRMLRSRSWHARLNTKRRGTKMREWRDNSWSTERKKREDEAFASATREASNGAPQPKDSMQVIIKMPLPQFVHEPT